MSTRAYIRAAEAAQQELNPAVDKALTEARDRLEKAETAANTDPRPELVAVIDNNAELPDAETAKAVVNQLSALAHKAYAGDGKHLVGLVYSAAKTGLLDQDRAPDAAGAVVKCLQDDLKPGLVRWPNRESWEEALDNSMLDKYARWLAPDAMAELDETRAKRRQDAARIQGQVEALEQAEDAINNLIPKGIQ